jgi:hypothetical protein
MFLGTWVPMLLKHQIQVGNHVWQYQVPFHGGGYCFEVMGGIETAELVETNRE